MQNKCIKGLLLSLIISQSYAMKFNDDAVVAPADMGKIELHHSRGSYYVKEGEKLSEVAKGFTDPLLRGRTLKQLKNFQKNGSISVYKFKEGEYRLTAQPKLKGSGLVGASLGAKIGMFTVHFLGHGTILIIGACTGPAAPATIVALEAAWGPSIIAGGKIGALTGGLLGGVLTGPV